LKLKYCSPRRSRRNPEYSEPAVVLNAASNEPVSLGEYVRQLRAHPAENIVVRAPEATTAEINNPVSHEEMSLGEYARQVASRRIAEPLIASEPAVVETAVDAGQPVSLADYVSQLRTMRALSASESATITPLPPVVAAKPRQPEISLGEYARQLRIRRAAEEYARLLAQDETPAILTAKLSVPIRYHEIRPTPPPSLRRAAPVADLHPAPQGQVAVTVRRGDSLWRLARTFLGAGARWRSLSFLKGHRGSPELIREGEVVLIPVSEAQRERALAIVADRRSGRPLR
jgi:nucleoid-associated protein YgaU